MQNADTELEVAVPIRANGRDPSLVEFERSMVGFFLQAAELLGVPKSLAVIYGVILASPEPLCFADLDERLEISKGSISQGLRVLREMGAIKAVPKVKLSAVSSQPSAQKPDPSSSASDPIADSRKLVAVSNDRREFYTPDMEMRKLIQRFLENKVQRQLELGSAKLTHLRQKLPKHNIHHTRILDERVKQLESWNAKTQALLPFIKTALKLSAL